MTSSDEALEETGETGETGKTSGTGETAETASPLDATPSAEGVTSDDLLDAAPEFAPERVLFQGSGLLVVDKPAGIPIHSSDGETLGLAELLVAWGRAYPGVLEIKAGKEIHPAHLLDKDASGVVLFGLNRPMRRRVQGVLAERDDSKRRVGRRYVAIVAGPMDAEGELHGRVRSKLRGQYRMMRSSLRYRRLAGDERLSLVEIEPREGRTHQIRTLFAAHNRPLAGDLRYGRPKPARAFLERFDVPSILLHVSELTLPAEILGAVRTFRAPLPQAFVSVLEKKGWPIDIV